MVVEDTGPLIGSLCGTPRIFNSSLCRLGIEADDETD